MSPNATALVTIAGYVLAQGRGRSDEQLATAVSVAMAESGGNPTARLYNWYDRLGMQHATNTPPPAGAHGVSVDRGLWQINSRWHPEVTDAMADDPVQATQAAYRISAGFTTWGAWATYNNGQSRRWLDAARAAVQQVKHQGDTYAATHPGGVQGALGAVGGAMVGAGGAAVDVAHAATSIPEFLGKLSSVGTWVRVVQVAGGMFLLLVGAGLLVGNSIIRPAAGQAAQQVKGAATAAGAAKLAATVL